MDELPPSHIMMESRDLERAIADDKIGNLENWHATYIVWLTLSLIIIGSHLFYIVLILGKRCLRVQSKNLLVVNVCLTNLLMGGFVMPAVIHLILDTPETDCNLKMAVRAINDYLQIALSLLTALSLILDRFFFVLQKPISFRFFRVIMTLVLMIAPWVLGCLLTLPLFFHAFVKGGPEVKCVEEVSVIYILLGHVFSFAIPAVLVFVFGTLVGHYGFTKRKALVIGLDCKHKPIYMRKESVRIVALVGVLAILPEVPYFVISMLKYTTKCNDTYCLDFFQGLKISIWLRATKAAFFPFIWLAYSDIRGAIMCRPESELNSGIECESEDTTTELSQQDTMLLRYR